VPAPVIRPPHMPCYSRGIKTRCPAY
jgi:hypothetical protein